VLLDCFIVTGRHSMYRSGLQVLQQRPLRLERSPTRLAPKGTIMEWCIAHMLFESRIAAKRALAFLAFGRHSQPDRQGKETNVFSGQQRNKCSQVGCHTRRRYMRRYATWLLFPADREVRAGIQAMFAARAWRRRRAVGSGVFVAKVQGGEVSVER
jgi:hypothetical protein